jgi:glycosyltransferase involved in cell wall biosynthesis
MNGEKIMKTAVLIPCFNEEKTIAKVISDFQKELPSADIYVYDNNSTDSTPAIAGKAGAIVRLEYRQGKGNVVRSMFRDIEADIYVLVDGDNTYPAESVHDLISPLVRNEADMVTGDRLSGKTYQKENKRPFHEFGNNIVTYFINKMFNASLHDVMSGYRGFNRFFVKTLLVLSEGFEIETEIVLHALDKRFLIKEVPIVYRDRVHGSYSKLKTFEDGIKVIRTILWIFKDYRPLVFFGYGSLIFLFLGGCFGLPAIIYLVNTFKLPSILFIVFMFFLAFFSTILFSVGLVLDTVVKFHRLDYEKSINDYRTNNPLRNENGKKEIK